MNSHCPLAVADEANTFEGYSYQVSVEAVTGGFQARLIWLSAPPQKELPSSATLLTHVFQHERAAIIEAHSLAQEQVLEWRAT